MQKLGHWCSTLASLDSFIRQDVIDASTARSANFANVRLFRKTVHDGCNSRPFHRFAGDNAWCFIAAITVDETAVCSLASSAATQATLRESMRLRVGGEWIELGDHDMMIPRRIYSGLLLRPSAMSTGPGMFDCIGGGPCRFLASS